MQLSNRCGLAEPPPPPRMRVPALGFSEKHCSFEKTASGYGSLYCVRLSHRPAWAEVGDACGYTDACAAQAYHFDTSFA
jgi:hypothetical protein